MDQPREEVARRAYEAARQTVLAGALAEFKARAAAATSIDDMWSLGEALRQRRRELDELLDYRYSQLTLVFGRLILEGHLDETQLAGLSESKMQEIRRNVSFMRGS